MDKVAAFLAVFILASSSKSDAPRWGDPIDEREAEIRVHGENETRISLPARDTTFKRPLRQVNAIGSWLGQ